MKQGPEVPNSYYRVSVKALITNDKLQILVVNERGTGWDLPGGGLDWGESPLEALKRELQEEIDCEAQIEHRPILISPAHAHSHNQHILWIIYRATLKSEAIRTTDNVAGVQYMSIQELREKEEAYEIGWESPIDFWGELEKLIG